MRILCLFKKLPELPTFPILSPPAPLSPQIKITSFVIFFFFKYWSVFFNYWSVYKVFSPQRSLPTQQSRQRSTLCETHNFVLLLFRVLLFLGPWFIFHYFFMHFLLLLFLDLKWVSHLKQISSVLLVLSAFEVEKKKSFVRHSHRAEIALSILVQCILHGNILTCC